MPSYMESQPGSRRSGERTGVSVLSTPKARPFSEGASVGVRGDQFPGSPPPFQGGERPQPLEPMIGPGEPRGPADRRR
jgi:hypothetical protein